MIETILVISILNLLLQVLAAYQRHQTLKHHRENGVRRDD